MKSHSLSRMHEEKKKKRARIVGRVTPRNRWEDEEKKTVWKIVQGRCCANPIMNVDTRVETESSDTVEGFDVERRMECGEKQGLNGHNSRAICYELEILCVHSREKWTRTPIDWIWRFAIGESNWASNCDWLLADFSFLFFSNSHSESSAIKNHRSQIVRKLE